MQAFNCHKSLLSNCCLLVKNFVLDEHCDYGTVSSYCKKSDLFSSAKFVFVTNALNIFSSTTPVASQLKNYTSLSYSLYVRVVDLNQVVACVSIHAHIRLATCFVCSMTFAPRI